MIVMGMKMKALMAVYDWRLNYAGTYILIKATLAYRIIYIH